MTFPRLKEFAFLREVNPVDRMLRRIRMQWTRDMVDDVRAFQGLDVVEELERLLTTELAHAAERDILINIPLQGISHRFYSTITIQPANGLTFPKLRVLPLPITIYPRELTGLIWSPYVIQPLL